MTVIRTVGLTPSRASRDRHDGDAKITPVQVCVPILPLPKLPRYSGGTSWLILEWLRIGGLQCLDCRLERSRRRERVEGWGHANSSTALDVAGPWNDNLKNLKIWRHWDKDQISDVRPLRLQCCYINHHCYWLPGLIGLTRSLLEIVGCFFREQMPPTALQQEGPGLLVPGTSKLSDKLSFIYLYYQCRWLQGHPYHQLQNKQGY